MRGIEGALKILGEVNRGAFAAEAIRKSWVDITPKERKLTATLVYAVLRRHGLWKHLLMKYCRRPVAQLHPRTTDLLLLGIAGTQELRHFVPGVLVNALVQLLKVDGGRIDDVGLVNAVLHKVMEDAPAYIRELKQSAAVRDLALVYGVPGWVAAQWTSEWGAHDGKRLIRLSTMKTYLSLRLSPETNRADWLKRLKDFGGRGWESSFLDYSVRMASNPFPVDLPGYAEGEITPQTESSMLVADLLASCWQGGALLDMCTGRGIKAAQILRSNSNTTIEAWDLSEGRLRAAEKEAHRLGVSERISFTAGNALELQPQQVPSAVFLDAPCSGSGTWSRHPEGKWRCQPEKVKEAALLQTQLLLRAIDLVEAGGVVFYATCSLFKEENEKVVAAALGQRPEMMEIPLRQRNRLFRKGKPFGTVIWPALPWVDGFYIAALKKRS